MSQVIQDTRQEFWRAPALDAQKHAVDESVAVAIAACPRCGTEFMIGSRFCHTCGAHRPDAERSISALLAAQAYLQEKLEWLHNATAEATRDGLAFPSWARYLHFHEIKRHVGLPTASLVAFMIGLGCVTGALAVGLLYKASNMAEFQAVQMWRIEWLLAATASFVAGILLKKPSSSD